MSNILNEARSFTNRFNSNKSNFDSDNLIIERANLLCVFKLVIKDLLNSSLKHERLLEKENFPLKHFFIVFEHILLHGYNGKKSFPINSASNRKDLWPVIDLISRKSTDTHMTDISISLKEMTNIRTPLGRVRAWLRLALMQKHLADYFKILLEQKQELNELYDNEALILSDENIIITGLLVGLNVLDFNFCLKETVLDYPSESTIHYSLYLRERRMLSIPLKNTHPPGAIQEPIDDLDDYSSLSSISSLPIIRTTDDTVVITNTDGVISSDENNIDSAYDQRLSSILDQKNYVEELNRKLQKTISTLQERIQLLEQTSKSLVEDAIEHKTHIEQVEEQLAKVTLEKEQIQSSYQRKIETLSADIEVERETYQKSRTGFDSIYQDLHKKYEEERVSKEKIANVYQTQMSQNSEIIQSTKLMEKDIEIKTTLNDRMKEDNHLLLQKLQIERTRNDEKENQIHSIGRENQMLRQTINELETSIEQTNKEKQALGDTNDKLNQQLTELDTEKFVYTRLNGCVALRRKSFSSKAFCPHPKGEKARLHLLQQILKTSFETDLRIEQESRQRLQKALTNEKDAVSTLRFDIHELNLTKQEYDLYKKEMTKKQNEYTKRFEEQEETIQQLALKLEIAMTREDELREKDGLRSSTWMKDEDVKECCQCKKEFNTIRRKHHCRSCGQIYCETCVSTKLTLASSNKPVRVCDMCCTRVLSQCAVKSP